MGFCATKNRRKGAPSCTPSAGISGVESPEICGERKKFITLCQGTGETVPSIIVKSVERFVAYGINNSYSR